MLLSLTVALVPPVARPRSHVVCSGAAYDYCVQALGCTAEEATKVEGRLIPSSAKSLTRAQAEERLGWLQSELGLSDSELKKVVLTFPALLGCSVEDNMELKLNWLETRLDLDAEQLRKIVLLLPAVLSYSVQDNMAPKFDWLQTRLDLDEEELKKMVVAFPAVLNYSVEGNM